MQVAISTTRPFHSAMLANALRQHALAVSIYTSAPRGYFRGLDSSVAVRLVPSALQTAMHLLRLDLPASVLHADSWIFDHSVAPLLRFADLGPEDIFVGWATASLASGTAAQRQGARFVLDRACPHVDAQQAIVGAEAAKVGARFTPQPAWFRDRQLEEYASADRILVPSEYTRRSFPPELQDKIIKAPLMGRSGASSLTTDARGPVFTVGVVGGDPLRKGYLYLLQAWERLKLPRARLLIRSSADFRAYPVLRETLARLENVELLPYVPDIADFFRQCDVFVLPSVDDGFGMALFEAMAHGVACIATTHCGSAELLTAGKDGLVVEPFSADALAAALASLYESEELRQTLATAGHQNAQRLAVNDISPLYEEAIDSLLASLHPAGQTAVPACW